MAFLDGLRRRLGEPATARALSAAWGVADLADVSVFLDALDWVRQ